MGMGRGAGNCQSELLIGFLKNPKYNVEPILDQIGDHMTRLREEGVKWGFDIPYILTGQLNSHPRTAIEFIKQGRTDYKTLRLDLLDLD
jgi:4-hydroxy 2-oxovalerate aldolase